LEGLSSPLSSPTSPLSSRFSSSSSQYGYYYANLYSEPQCGGQLYSTIGFVTNVCFVSTTNSSIFAMYYGLSGILTLSSDISQNIFFIYIIYIYIYVYIYIFVYVIDSTDYTACEGLTLGYYSDPLCTEVISIQPQNVTSACVETELGNIQLLCDIGSNVPVTYNSFLGR
jgi:hypothetical protein